MINIFHKRFIGFSAVLMLSLLWGSNFPIAKIGITKIGAIEFRLASSIICVVPILIFCLVKENFRSLSLSEFIKLSFVSIFNVAAVPTLNNLSLSYTGASNATILIYTMPACTTLISWLLGKSFSLNGLFSVCFCVLGVVFLSNISGGINPGEMIILSSALIWSIGTLLQARLNPQVSLLMGTTVQLFVGTAIVFCYYNFFYGFDKLNNIDLKDILSGVLPSLIFTGVFGGSIAYFLWFFLIKNFGAIFASYSILFSPIVGVLVSHFLLNEKLTILMMSGLSCMLVSIIFSRKDKETLRQ